MFVTGNYEEINLLACLTKLSLDILLIRKVNRLRGILKRRGKVGISISWPRRR